MHFSFSKEDIESGKSTVDLEELILKVHFIDGSGKEFVLNGDAIVEDETYNNFEVSVVLEADFQSDNLFGVLEADWLEYDYIF